MDVRPGDAPDSLPCLNRARLAEFTGGDAELERELLELYLGSAEGYLARLRRAATDGEGWRRSAHALKGASANVGALELAALARDAERLGPDGARVATLGAALGRVRAAAGV